MMFFLSLKISKIKIKEQTLVRHSLLEGMCDLGSVETKVFHGKCSMIHKEDTKFPSTFREKERA